MRDSDTVARLGGDEFVILAEDLESDGEALALAERVLHALEEPFQVGAAEVSMLASVGVSVSHDPDADPEAMLREADVAMYRAKGAGGRGLELFDESLRRRGQPHLEIEGRLRHALPRRRAAAGLPADPAARRRARGRLRGARALAAPRRATSQVETCCPRRSCRAPRRASLIVQIGDWVLAHRLRAGRGLAARRDRDPDVR